MEEKYDFSGWATKNDIRCSDGRTIKKDAFIDNDGLVVPLVWNHDHGNVSNVLGHAMLENKDKGVYAYCTFNDTVNGQEAKELVKHGDIVSLSIYANQIKEKNGNVIHGNIREVSLVMAGANPGAFIDTVMVHGEEYPDEAIIYADSDLYLAHSENNKQDDTNDDVDETVEDVINTMNDKQKKVLYSLIGAAVESNNSDDEDDSDNPDDEDNSDNSDNVDEMNNKNNTKKGDDEMKHNAFEETNNNKRDSIDALIHSEEMANAIANGKTYGLMSESFKRNNIDMDAINKSGILRHSATYGIENIGHLFPDYQPVNPTPEFINRDNAWVSLVMNSVHKTPFSRIKSIFADITTEDARAKGYLKGSLKKEEVFSLLKRTTDPTTVYKKQKLDRDDVIDITSFDVIVWLKDEMRMMLNEEIARAILVGDGRSSISGDKVKEDCVRPIWTDADLYTIKTLVPGSSKDDPDTKAKAAIKAAIKARKNYKGSGNPILFTTEDMLTDMLLLTDSTGRDLYDSVEKLAIKLRVSQIVTVPVMEGLHRTDSVNGEVDLLGIMVNLADYNVGADKGGDVNLFDDFDIDYNQQKYLIETRCSGALIKPYSAIAIEIKQNA